MRSLLWRASIIEVQIYGNYVIGDLLPWRKQNLKLVHARPVDLKVQSAAKTTTDAYSET